MADPQPEFHRGRTPAFHKVIALHEQNELNFEELKALAPTLSRGWFELSRLSNEDRIEFTKEFWLSKLSFPEREIEIEKIVQFFDSVDEIGLLASQQREGGIFEVHMVYSLKDEGGYFHGSPLADGESIENLVSQFSQFSFPSDYLAFLSIHNGFCKFTDTGLIRIRDMSRSYLRFQEELGPDALLTIEGQMIDPKNLIPFYEAFGLNSYQCFCDENLPFTHVNNVYYSEFEGALADNFERRGLDENFIFPSFLSWLCFYLEDVGLLE